MAVNTQEEMKALKSRIMVLEASLADCKNQVELVRKEVTEQIFKELDDIITGCEEGYNLMLCIPDEKAFNKLKSKYGIK
jgi:FKBP-type peptidyl-prolyl cis-trans isomerase 2